MSYYEEGQAGFGGLGFALPALNLSTTSPASTAARTNVGIDPAIIAALGTYLTALGGAFGSSDTNRTPMITSGVLLKSLKPNSFGKIDPAAVTQSLNIMPPALQTYAANALSMNASQLAGAPYADAAAALRQMGVLSITGLLSDIAAGKYDGTLPTVSVKLSPSLALKTPVLLAPQGSPALVTTVATAANTASTATPDPHADVQCPDGYYRDANGLCLLPDTPASLPPAADTTSQNTLGPSDLVGPSEAVPQPVTQAATSSFPWLYVGIGAAGLAVVGWALMSRKSATPNRSRKSRKNRRHSKRVRRAARKA